MPEHIFFYCDVPASEGGQTPLADCRAILKKLDPAVVERFARTGIKYVNNLHDGFGVGRSWQDTFQTSDARDVEARLAADGYGYEWRKDGGLRTWIVCDAVKTHPVTGERAWINQAEQWHVSSLEPNTRRALLDTFDEADLPHNAYFGDGSSLSEHDLGHVREVMAHEEVVFDWAQGDLLVCDNILVAHGRRPFAGDRRVLVAMA